MPVEYRIDLFAVLILLGLVQAVFLSIFYLGREVRKIPVNRYQGIFLLAVGGILLEVLLMYTGYILGFLHLVDFSEPLALLIGPMILFIVHGFIHGDAPPKKRLHYIIPVAYALYNVFLLIQPVEVKYNGYLNAYHPDWPRVDATPIFSDDPLNIRTHHSLFTALSILLYTLLALKVYVSHCLKVKMSFWRVKDVQVKSGRNYVLVSTVMVVAVFLFKTLYDHDLGDHYIALSITILIYYTSFELIRSAQLLKLVPAAKRYSKSSLSVERKSDLVARIKSTLAEGEAHLSIGYGLIDLAKTLRVSSHHLSEAINEGFDKTFFELLAEYRIEAARQLLRTADGQRLKVEEIAERVGYSSKSSFNTQFKKITGKTPSQFRDEV